MDSRRMCPHCRAFITSKDRTCPYCGESVGARMIDVRNPSPIAGLIPANMFNTVLLISINVFLYVLTVVFSMKSGKGDFMSLDGETLVDFGGKYGPLIAMGQWWRYVTANFLHGGLWHVGMNMYALYTVGATAEEIYGPSRMYVIYFVSGFCGFVASNLWSGGLSIGASAAIFGLIGAMLALGVKHRNPMGDAIRGLYLRWAIWGLVIGFLPGFAIDNAAHIGGLASGFAVAWVAGTPRLLNSPTEKLWKIACFCCILITVVSFLAMYLSFSRNAQ